MKKIIYLLTAAVVLLNSCKKADFADNNPTGEGLVDFTLTAPESGRKVVLNAATPNAPVVFTWNGAKPGLITSPTYKVVMALKAGGDLNSPLLEFDATGTTVSLTQKQLDDALKAKSVADGATTELVWSVRATNGSVTILSTSVFNISITRMKDGASPFLLLGPNSSLTPVAIDPGSTTSSFKFNWTRSKPAAGGPAVTYRVLFAERKTDVNGIEIPTNWNTPLFSVAPDAAPNDSVATITYKALSDSLNKYGLTNLSVPSSLKWTVVATSGTWKQQADYVNDIAVLREVRMYMPGNYQTATGNGNDWDPPTAPEFIRDLRPGAANTLYYMYIYLPANAEFKITQGRSWDVNYGGSGGNLNGGANLSVSTAGYYRISVDRVNLKYDIREGRIGFVGGATGAGWNPPNIFPTYALGAAGKNLFVGVTDFTAGGWKLLDFNDWNNGDLSVTNARSYGTAGPSGSPLEVNGPNMPDITVPGRYRVIWDGRNVDNVKYEMSPASEMRVVGNGMQGVAEWTPSASPQMTYSGNGVWTITLTLIAGKEIKFLAGNDWGAFDYEDNSGGSTGNTPRGIRWEGGDNFKTPTVTGSYTITLNEKTQTLTIN